MELEDLVLRIYRVERRDDEMVAIQDPNGNYKADSAQRIERVLNTNCRVSKTDNIFFRTTGRGAAAKWRPMRRN